MIKQVLRKTASSLLYGLAKRNRESNGIRILTYHRVRNNSDSGDRLSVSPLQFAEQMGYLARNQYQTPTLEQVRDHVVNGRPIPERAVAITFDDGYRDIFEHAFPILQDYGFTATVFIVADWVDGEHDAIRATNSRQNRPFLDWEEVRAMASAGITIGSHTRSHPNLVTLPPESVQAELERSKRTIEHHLGQPVTTFCYPYGKFNRLVRALVQEAGYLSACSYRPGANIQGVDPFILRRTEISPQDSLFDFHKKLHGAYDPLHRLMQWASP